MNWKLSRVTPVALVLAACTGAPQPAPTAPSELSGVTLGKPAHLLAARSAGASSFAVAPRILSGGPTPSDHVDEILRHVNDRVQECHITPSSIGSANQDGRFFYQLYAAYPDRTYSEGVQFSGDLTMSPATEGEAMLDMVPGQVFQFCRRAAPGNSFSGEGKQHLDQMVPALNDHLTGCTLRVAGAVGEPDSDGNFRFYLEAVYPNGSVDKKVHFETNWKNVITNEVNDFLALIPSQAFHQCQHKVDNPNPPTPNPPTPNPPTPNPPTPNPPNPPTPNPPTPNPPTPNPPNPPTPNPPAPPGPDADPLRHAVRAVILSANDKLEKCSLFQVGDVGSIKDDGTADYYMNAQYIDGSEDKPRRFIVSSKIPVADQVAELMQLIPGQMFRSCHVKGAPGPNPDPHVDEARRYVADVLSSFNDQLANCIVALSGHIGAVDDHGDFFFYLTAYVREDGAFTDPARFQGNMYQPKDASVGVLMKLIPAVEFKTCRHK